MAETTALVYGRDTVLAWQAAVKARGGIAIVFPQQADTVAHRPELVGKPAERYPAAVIAQLKLGEPVLWSVGRTFGYYPAGAATGSVTGAKVNAFDKANRVQMTANIAAGEVAATAEKVAGVFKWGSVAVVAVALVGGYLVLRGRD